MTLYYVKQFHDEELHELIVNSPDYAQQTPLNKTINDRSFADCMQLLRSHLVYIPRQTVLELMVPAHLVEQVDTQCKLEGLL